jgi:dTDP-4-amino-4,6-dideoxygalactose transaminase
MIPLFKVRMNEEAPKLLEPVLLSGFIGQGPKVEEFEDMLQEHLGTETRPVTLNSCTNAIDLALELCGVGVGDEVIATPQTCFASQVGAIHRGAILRWADIDPITGLIDPDSVAKLVNEKTKAIIAVNWAGRFCDFDALGNLGVPVIEDAAHTWDTFLIDDDVVRGDYICYSLQAIKFLTSGDGGILICPTKEKEAEARILRWFGLDRTKNESFRCTQNITRAGFKYHMNDINATIGMANMNAAFDSVCQSRFNSFEIITRVDNPNLIMPYWDDSCSFWLFSMHVLNGRKAEFQKYLEDNGIASSPVHYRNDLYDCTIRFAEGDLPGVTEFDKTQVCIPNGWWVDDATLNHIIKVLNEFK